MGKILILGGSNTQMNAVLMAKDKGHTVIVSDYYEDAPGKLYADHSELTSTFDAEGNIKVARKYGADGVMTMGTDQPVLTAASVACELGLPSFINVDTARAVTNKRIMKSMFVKYGIPTVKYKLIKEDFSLNDLEGIRFPVVIKPLDSQGQRGVYKLDEPDAIRTMFGDVLSYSREKEILVEEYYKSDEITMSGWVRDGRVYILTVTDRITYNNYPHIGVCTAHNFPSKYADSHLCKIEDITNQIVKNFGIHNGPLYFQMLIGDQGIKVNEIACRIGGAYEDELIPILTGVDILEMVIKGCLGENIDYLPLERYNFRENKKLASVRMIFTRPGIIKTLSRLDEIKRVTGVRYAGYNFSPGYNVREISNATQRAGYMIIEGDNMAELKCNIERAFNRIRICDEKGDNMILNFLQGSADFKEKQSSTYE